ncbi:hypothetical protein PM8797T_05095 [Gimesia maris DSM 8797]|uniref:Uncharacterized protein n=1 Tax=Gimesia maris TaxID=122 RepID=A0ABX5YGU8_9PLAN|nr:hypothetical protein PM8797T_05095 [Gimesia maris DSM 8797]QDU13028.1 hypothetical protein CA11_08100 [Gimesia maris]QEG14957.1 hypothetical protein GmarT_07950 [Gimesia maris]
MLIRCLVMKHVYCRKSVLRARRITTEFRQRRAWVKSNLIAEQAAAVLS